MRKEPLRNIKLWVPQVRRVFVFAPRLGFYGPHLVTKSCGQSRDAMSPGPALDGSGNVALPPNGTSRLDSRSLIWGTNSVFGESVLWGTTMSGQSVLWGTYTHAGLNILRGTNGAGAASILWGTSVLWGTASIGQESPSQGYFLTSRSASTQRSFHVS